MVEAYAKLIMAGKKTLDQVPEKLRETVKKLLEEAGWKPEPEHA